MKKLLTIIAITFLTTAFSQVSMIANLPAKMTPGSTVDVEVKIIKGTVNNFAKYQMDVPPGYVVTAIDVKSGNFSFENQRAKIVWVSIPNDLEFTIKFKLQANADASDPGNFSQKLYYLDNNEKKEVEAPLMSISLGGSTQTTSGETLATDTKPKEPVKVEMVKTETIPEKVKTEVVKTEKLPEPVKKEVQKVETPVTKSSTPATSESGVTFRVQLGSFAADPGKAKFANAGKVNIDAVGGAYKVTAGNFKTKEEAVKYRDELQTKGFSGFIIKFKDGKRID